MLTPRPHTIALAYYQRPSKVLRTTYEETPFTVCDQARIQISASLNQKISSDANDGKIQNYCPIELR